MSAYDELRRTGEISHEFVSLLLRLAKAVVRVRNFPALAPHSRWDGDALNELVQDFCCARPITERVALLIAEAPSEAAFVTRLEIALIRHIQSSLRRTPRGSVARTVRHVIDDDARFKYRQDHVALVVWDDARAPSECDEQTMRAAVACVLVTVPSWNPASQHRAPIADRQSLAALCNAVLVAAGGPVQFNTVLDLIIERCLVPGLAKVRPGHELPHADEPSVDARGYAAARAMEIWVVLTDPQRKAVGSIGDSVRQAGERLGVGKTRASELLGEARGLLADHLRDEPDQAAVARELLLLAARPDS